MDIALLRTFLEVARSRHFGKAAETLFVTQSAVSARIKLLESTLGVALFERKRNDIRLTPSGMRLRKHAETIVKGWDRARLDVALDPESSDSLSVGCVVDLWAILVRDWCVALRRSDPKIVLQVDVQPTEILNQRLVSGVLDMVFLFEPAQIPDLTLKQVAEVPLIMVSSLTGLSAPDAVEQDYYMVDWGTSFAEQHTEHFPDVSAPSGRLGSGALALDLLLRLGGTAYLPEQMVMTDLEAGTLYRVESAPVIERFVYAVYKPAAQSRRAMKTALDTIKDTVVTQETLKAQNALERIRHLAFHDPLTGLANRLLFHERLAHAMIRVKRREELLGVMLIDLDGFKEVNDRWGHAAGDKLLVQVAERLSSSLRKSDTIARLRGDEFAILVEGIKSISEGEDIARKTLLALRDPFTLDAGEAEVTGSLGIVFFPFADDELSTLMAQADAAMYEAKRCGRDRYRLFEDGTEVS